MIELTPIRPEALISPACLTTRREERPFTHDDHCPTRRTGRLPGRLQNLLRATFYRNPESFARFGCQESQACKADVADTEATGYIDTVVAVVVPRRDETK